MTYDILYIISLACTVGSKYPPSVNSRFPVMFIFLSFPALNKLSFDENFDHRYSYFVGKLASARPPRIGYFGQRYYSHFRRLLMVLTLIYGPR